MKVLQKEVVYEDERGTIRDILFNEVIEHVTIISSKKGAIRGNHYHKHTSQYTYVIKGSFKVISQMRDEQIEVGIIKQNDLLFTPPMVKHVLISLEDSEILALTRGPRGGKSYESDTFRLHGAESLLSKIEEVVS
jgi:dTDP-4-dehydrorhamnose 3,5-epimerase-like enzyme